MPQGDRIGKKQAYQELQQADLGPLGTESPAFKRWLFINNVGGETRDSIGSGIVAVTLEEKWPTRVQLLLTRSDHTEVKLQIVQNRHGACTTEVLPPDA